MCPVVVYAVCILVRKQHYNTVVDPGFLLGGVDLVGGGMDSQGSYVSKILYVKMKELGPLGGTCQVRPLDLPMQYIDGVHLIYTAVQGVKW